MSDSSFFSQSGSNEATATTINTKVNEAEAAKAAAEAAQAAAEAARDQANTSAADAQSSEDDAETAQAASEAARDTAVLNAGAASASAVQSSTFRDDARKLAIELEDTQYQLSDGTIGYSALHYHEKASDSASAAAVSAGAASVDAGTASQDAATATTKAGEASASALAASQSEQNAAQSESNAGQSETNAAQSEANASQSETNAAASASTATTQAGTATTQAGIATTQAGTATTKAGEASNSASSALSAQSAAEAARDSALSALDNFQDQYLGSYTSAPTATADGDPLASGMLYFNETDDAMKVYDGSQWLNAYASLSGALIANQNLSDLNNAATARTNLGLVAVASSGAYSDLTGTPTTIAGYGITDAFDGAFSSLTGKPTTVSGYGITDVPDDLLDLGITDGSNGQALKTDGAGNFSFGDVATSTAWADITGKPTTISGFGITDAFDGAYSSLTGTPDLTNYITNNVGGDFTVDSGTLFVDSSTNRVGINLGSGVSPTVPLNVAGTVRFQSTSSAGQMLEFTNYSSYSKLYRSNGSLQLQGGNTGNGILELSNSGGFTFDGNTIYHSGNLPTIPTNNNQLTNGAGYITSADGGNAATLDGIDSSQFLRSDADDTMTGDLLMDSANAEINIKSGVAGTTGRVNWTFDTTTTNYASLSLPYDTRATKGFHMDVGYPITIDATSQINFDISGTNKATLNSSGNLALTGTSHTAGGNTIWHAGNDGSGSGLDADTLDGQHGSYYRPVGESLFYKSTREAAGSYLDLNAATTPGIYRLHSAGNHTGHPTGSGYGFNIVLDNADVHGHILLDRLDGGTMHIRAKTGTTWTTSEWNKVWTTGNDGSGSGLDADTVDGIEASNFLRSDTSDTMSGNLTLDNSTGSSTLSVRGNGTGMAKIWARGSNQATGMVMVSQDDNHGGGIEYNGDGNPSTTGAGSDYIALFRVASGTYSWTARNFYSSNDWEFRGNVTAYASDERLKENIETIPNALDKVCKLRGVTFDWKDDCEDKGFMPTMKHETGVLAQNVQSQIPDAAVPAPFNDEYLTVKHEKIIPVLIEAIKELKAEIEELKKG